MQQKIKGQIPVIILSIISGLAAVISFFQTVGRFFEGDTEAVYLLSNLLNVGAMVFLLLVAVVWQKRNLFFGLSFACKGFSGIISLFSLIMFIIEYGATMPIYVVVNFLSSIMLLAGACGILFKFSKRVLPLIAVGVALFQIAFDLLGFGFSFTFTSFGTLLYYVALLLIILLNMKDADGATAPVFGQAAYQQSVYQQTTYQQTTYQQPMYQQPVAQPMYQQPTYQQPVAQPTYQQPAYQQPVAQPTYQQPVYQQPVAQPTYQQPAYQQPAYQQPAPQQQAGGFVPLDWRKYAPLEAGISMKLDKDYKFHRAEGFVGSVPQSFVNRTFPKCPLCCNPNPYWTIAQHNQMSMKGNLYLFKCSCCDGVISMSMPDVTTLGNGAAGIISNPNVGLTNLLVKSSNGREADAVYAVIETVGRSGVDPECQGKEFKLEHVQDMCFRM